jgi:hypothetical protein
VGKLDPCTAADELISGQPLARRVRAAPDGLESMIEVSVLHT